MFQAEEGRGKIRTPLAFFFVCLRPNLPSIYFSLSLKSDLQVLISHRKYKLIPIRLAHASTLTDVLPS